MAVVVAGSQSHHLPLKGALTFSSLSRQSHSHTEPDCCPNGHSWLRSYFSDSQTRWPIKIMWSLLKTNSESPTEVWGNGPQSAALGQKCWWQQPSKGGLLTCKSRVGPHNLGNEPSRLF